MKKDQINRREFIKKTAGFAAYAALGMTPSDLFHTPAAASQWPDIAVADGGAAPATRAAVQALGGIKRFVKPGQNVVVKPNMSFSTPPEQAANTRPEVVREIVKMCLEASARSVHVLDNPLRGLEICLEKSQIRDACADLPNASVQGIEDKRFFRDVDVPRGQSLTSTRIMNQVLQSDVLIAVPVAKSHSSAGVSLAMKGMMGLIYSRKNFHFLLDLHTAIVDLCTVLKPQLTIIDATRILSDGGPGGPGTVITLNKIIASTDMVAADAAAVELGTWYGKKFSASQVKHIKMAHDRGVGNMDIKNQVVKEVSA